MMQNNVQPHENRKSNQGLGIAMGLSIGSLAGLLFLNGNIGLGISIGLIFGILADGFRAQNTATPFSLLISALLGSLAGLALGIVLGLLHGIHAAYVGYGHEALFGLAFKNDYLILAVIAAGVGVCIRMMVSSREGSQQKIQ